MNATGVMPVIFSTSLLAAPVALARFTDNPGIQAAAAQLTNPAGPFYLPVSIDTGCDVLLDLSFA